MDVSGTPLEPIRNERFDVLIADIKMKGVDGIELVEFTRNRSPEAQVIMPTAFATLETAVKAPDQQAFGCFDKLVRIAEFEASVNRALQSQ